MPSNRSTRCTSSKIQNKLIEIYEKVILDKIVSKVNEAECFIALDDELLILATLNSVHYIGKINSEIILK